MRIILSLIIAMLILGVAKELSDTVTAGVVGAAVHNVVMTLINSLEVD